MDGKKQLSAIKMIEQLLQGNTSHVIIVHRSFFTDLIKKILEETKHSNVNDN